MMPNSVDFSFSVVKSTAFKPGANKAPNCCIIPSVKVVEAKLNFSKPSQLPCAKSQLLPRSGSHHCRKSQASSCFGHLPALLLNLRAAMPSAPSCVSAHMSVSKFCHCP